MAKKIITQDFFKQDTLKVAKQLLGKIIECNGCRGIIVETEAYKEDEASHAKTKTERSKLMHESYGHVYVYLIYGMYNCLNFTSDIKPGAVLIRAIEPINGLDLMMKRRKTQNIHNLCSGPGKLCQAFNITKKYNTELINKNVKLYDMGKKPKIACSPRRGIIKATHLEWRFFVKDNKFVS